MTPRASARRPLAEARNTGPRRAVPRELIVRGDAHAANQLRPEAGHTLAAGMPHPVVDDAVRPGAEQLARERLRRGVGIGIVQARVRTVTPDVVKGRREV